MAVRSDSRTATRILIWSTRGEFVQEVKRSFSKSGFRAFRAGAAFSESLREVLPSAIIIDGTAGAEEALGVCTSAESAAKNTPVLLLAAREDGDTVKRALRLGVADFAEEPASGELLAVRVQSMLRRDAERAHLRREAAEAESRAERDGLTGLQTRTSFISAIESALVRAKREGHPVALLYLDLDRFKGINDTLGHSVGDALLQEVARLLRSQVRPTDVVGAAGEPSAGVVSRLGGDEFTVLLSKVHRAEDAGEVACRILEAVKAPLSLGGHEVSTTASAGIAVFPQDGKDAETLLKRADMAMYEAKAYGSGCYRFYQPSMGKALLRRLELEEHLRRALERGELELRYQPRVNVRADTLAGMEALLRWNSPELGWVQPSEFIPVAEETDLITPIGAWVLETACAQLARWQSEGWSGLRVSVNVSPQQFASSDVGMTVTDALRKSGLEPDALELEVTESLILGDDESIALALRDLRGIGVALALDDFGTGYSSLSFITRFPLDVLKVDRSIASAVDEDPAAASVVEAVVAMGGRLGLRIVAEGVDSMEQATKLRELGCDEIQGFLVSQAVTAEEFRERFRAWRGLFRNAPEPG